MFLLPLLNPFDFGFCAPNRTKLVRRTQGGCYEIGRSLPERRDEKLKFERAFAPKKKLLSLDISESKIPGITKRA
jgi:hypothetical protein